MNSDLRTKLTLILATVMLVTVALVSILANMLIAKQFTDYLQSQQEQRITKIADELMYQYDSANQAWNSSGVHLLGMAVLNEGYLISLTDQNQNSVWDARTCDMTLCDQVTSEISNRMSENQRWEGAFTIRSIELEESGEVIGTLTIEYYGPFFLSEDDSLFLQALNRILGGIVVFTLLMALVLGSMLAKRLSRPILKTTEAAKKIADGDYSIRLDVCSHTYEIDELMGSINKLAQSLAEQEQIRKQLSADVAHELRTPLTAVGTHLEAMIEGIWEPTQTRLESCHDEILRIGRIVEDLENLARVESSSFKLEKTELVLGQLIRRVLKNFEAAIEQKKLELSFTGNEAVVFVDEHRLTQVLINVISNAIKYSKEGGQIEITIEETADAVTLTIRDNGIGISEADLPHIFERFYRVDKSRNRMTGGSGIGLAVVKAIVLAHGGNVLVTSKLDEGSVFSIVLPRNKMEEYDEK